MKSAADVWEKVKSLMEGSMTAVSIETWFGDIEAVSLEDTRLVLCVPTDFKRNIIRTRFLPAVEQALRELTQENSEFLEQALRELFSFDVDVALLLPEERDTYNAQNVSSAPVGQEGSERYTFERFVVGSTNRFAYTAAKKVAEEPGGAYNPLFIYGQSGLGKTHLLHAIANQVHQVFPAYRIMYVQSEDFVNEFIDHVRHGMDMQGFRDKYRLVDLFLMDDVQFIAGKDSSEEELFHTFNTLYEQKKQIVFTSDRPPHEMLRLEQRLRTRFEQGLPADIQPPDYETRVALLKNKAVERGISLPDAVLSYVAENITSNVRQIEGVVNKIMAFQELMGAPVDVDTTIRAVRDILRAKENFLPSADTIIQEVARFYELDSTAIRGQSQNKEIANARNVAMYIIREMTQLSLMEIGQHFGGRHHSTVLNSIKRVEKNMKEQPEMSEIIRDITNAVNSAY